MQAKADKLESTDQTLMDAKAYIAANESKDPMLYNNINTMYDKKAGGGGGCVVM